ncbi:MAG: hypothetical protein ABR552_03515 [Actinomycetota bacterium]
MRRVLFLASLLCLAGLSPARAGVSAGASMSQSISLQAFDPASGAQLELYVVGTATASNGTQPVSLSWVASGAYRSQTLNIQLAPNQQISPTASTFDLLGNSGTFSAQLTRDSTTPGPPVAFNLTFTRPASLGYCLPCVNQNAWYDPSTSSLSASASAFPGIYRNGYTVGGTAFDLPYPTNGFGFTFYQTTLPALAGGTAP